MIQSEVVLAKMEGVMESAQIAIEQSMEMAIRVPPFDLPHHYHLVAMTVARMLEMRMDALLDQYRRAIKSETTTVV